MPILVFALLGLLLHYSSRFIAENVWNLRNDKSLARFGLGLSLFGLLCSLAAPLYSHILPESDLAMIAYLSCLGGLLSIIQGIIELFIALYEKQMPAAKSQIVKRFFEGTVFTLNGVLLIIQLKDFIYRFIAYAYA